MKQYATIIADPPWTYTDTMRKMKHTGKGAVAHYDCLSLEAIRTFLRDHHITVATDAYLFLWTTNAFMEQAHGIAWAWGFDPKTIVTWVKGRIVNDTLVQHIGQGRHFRNSTEHCIVAARGHPQRLVKNLPTAFVYPGRWPGRKHSEKPARLHELAEQFFVGPRLELFARRQRKGWDALGDEVAA